MIITEKVDGKWVHRQSTLYDVKKFYANEKSSTGYGVAKRVIGVFSRLIKYAKAFIVAKKQFRTDLNRWETTYSIRQIPFLYKYSLFKEKTKRSIFKKQSSTCRYVVCSMTGGMKIPITQSEFMEKYNGNKWLVPLNKFVVA